MTIAVLDGGTYYHRETIHGDRYRGQFDRVVYAPDLTAADLEGVDTLIVPDRLSPTLLRRHRDLLNAFPATAGRTLVVMGENDVPSWLDGAVWSPRPTNFWWWLDQGAVPPHQFPAPDHPLFGHIRPADAIWHFHGVLQPPPGATVLVAVPADLDGRDGGGALLYEDRATRPGRLIVATLDPFYHHGSRFMPATTRFLDGFLPWLKGG